MAPRLGDGWDIRGATRVPSSEVTGERRCTRSAEQVEGGPGVSSPLRPVREQLLPLAPAPDHTRACAQGDPSFPRAQKRTVREIGRAHV